MSSDSTRNVYTNLNFTRFEFNDGIRQSDGHLTQDTLDVQAAWKLQVKSVIQLRDAFGIPECALDIIFRSNHARERCSPFIGRGPV
jgi:hypothetical protein